MATTGLPLRLALPFPLGQLHLSPAQRLAIAPLLFLRFQDQARHPFRPPVLVKGDNGQVRGNGVAHLPGAKILGLGATPTSMELVPTMFRLALRLRRLPT